MPASMTRREWVAGAAAFTQAGGAAPIPTRPLGKTGVRVSILGLGGHHAARPMTKRGSAPRTYARCATGSSVAKSSAAL